jgi:nucleoside-diphosphate-sugar epimerase
MRVFIVGIGGRVGSAIARACLARGGRCRVRWVREREREREARGQPASQRLLSVSLCLSVSVEGAG